MIIQRITRKSYWINFIFFQTIFACNRYNCQINQSKIVLQPVANKAIATTIENAGPAHKNKEATFGIVLLHGLSMDRQEMQVLTEELFKKYTENILIINSSVREKGNSENYSIDRQVEMVYQEIKDSLMRQHKDSQSFPLFILGQSQGGIVATLIAERYKHILHLLGFITHNAPLKGANILTRGPGDIRKFQNKASKGLHVINTKLNPNLCMMATLAKMAYYTCPLLDCIGYKKFTGIRDTLPNSRCIETVHRYLRNSQQIDPIPGLLIAGYQNDYGRLFGHAIANHKEQYQAVVTTEEVDQAIQALNHATAMLITGDRNGLHDHLIPLKSQLCRGDSLEDLTHIGDKPYQVDMPGNPNITGFVIRDITHCSHLFPIAEKEIEEEVEEYMMNPLRMLPVLFQFIEEKLKKENIASIL